jgi:hypothetical protein
MTMSAVVSPVSGRGAPSGFSWAIQGDIGGWSP